MSSIPHKIPHTAQSTFRTRRKDSVGPSSSSSAGSLSVDLNADSSPPSSPGLPASDDSRMSDVDEGEDVNKNDCGGIRPGADSRWAMLNTSPAHPFSASTHANRRPPSYAKDSKRAQAKRRKNSETATSAFDPFLDVQRSLAPAHSHDTYQFDPYPSTKTDFEAELWEKTIEHAIQHADSSIDITGQGLTYIPPDIEDLSKLVVLDTHATSPREAAPSRTVSVSTNSVMFNANRLGTRSDEIHLYLGNNKITYLPRELFSLNSLVVLSLRSNMLTDVPPDICKLHNLKELHIPNNRLTHVPAELMKLRLTALTLHPNPFTPNPSPTQTKSRWCGPTERLHAMNPLSEICLRVLLAPHTSGLQPLLINARCKTVLEALYDLPIPSDYEISPGLKEILASCVPSSVTSSLTIASTPDELRKKDGVHPCVSECPSSKHLKLASNGAYSKPVFVGHAEERMTWEKEIAGQKVGDMGVPVLWRGCSAGCLDFLDSSEPTEDEDMMDSGWTPAKMDLDGDDGVVMFEINGTSNPSRTEFTGMFSSEDIDLDD